MYNIDNFKSGDTVLFTAIEVDGTPAFAYDKEPVQVNEIELELIVIKSSNSVSFIDTVTNEKYSFNDLVQYKDDYTFKVIKEATV